MKSCKSKRRPKISSARVWSGSMGNETPDWLKIKVNKVLSLQAYLVSWADDAARVLTRTPIRIDFSGAKFD